MRFQNSAITSQLLHAQDRTRQLAAWEAKSKEWELQRNRLQRQVAPTSHTDAQLIIQHRFHKYREISSLEARVSFGSSRISKLGELDDDVARAGVLINSVREKLHNVHSRDPRAN